MILQDPHSSVCSFLSRWLIDTFGPELLASGTGILDVAGGMGDLSWELHNVNKLTSTVMDPRPLDHKYSVRKLKVPGRDSGTWQGFFGIWDLERWVCT